MRGFLICFGVLALGATAALAVRAPAAPTDTPQLGDVAIPKVPHPYDESADAGQAVDAALAAAKTSGKRVLIAFGANWCADCKALAGVLTLDPVKAWSDKHYQLVDVDVGRFDHNTDVAARFGLKLTAIPALVVVSPDGKVVNTREELAMDDARSMTAQSVVDILSRWAVTPAPAS